MSLCQDLRGNQPQLKFPLYEFLTAVAKVEPASTSEIESTVGSSYETAIKKLKELQALGVVKSTRVGAAHQWRLAPFSLEKSSRMEADSDQETIVCLLIETVDSIACNLSQHELLADDIPSRFQQWLAGRNMDDSHRAREVLSRACVFDFFLKSAIYALYEPEHEKMGELSVETDFAACFAEAERVTQNKGLELSVPGELIGELDQPDIRTILALRSVLNSISHPAETLSIVYERLFVQDARRDLGQFATPNYISEILTKWAINEPNDTILDPGVGAGMLSSAAVMEKIHRGADKPLQDIRANDIDELGVSMAAVSLKLVDGPGSPVLKRGNFLKFEPNDWTENEHVENQSVDAVVANPPYSRSQAMETGVKTQTNRVISDETGIDFHGKSPLYVYFLAHAAQFVADGGHLAFIIPSGFMETEFGVPFKQYLLDCFRIEAIVQLDEEDNTFRGVRTTTSLLFLKYEQPPENHETTFINLPSWPEIDSFSEILEIDFSDDTDEDRYRVDLLQRLLSPEDNWQHYFSPTETSEIEGLGDFTEIATIKRGIATGNNDLFCLNREDLADHDIPDRFLQPIIKSAQDIPGYEITKKDWEEWRDKGKDVWLLYAYEDGEKFTDGGPLEDFLSYAAETFDMDRELFNRRNPWYCVDKRDPTPILAKYMSRTGSQFIYNKNDLRTLNNFHNIDPNFEDDEERVKALLAYLNSNIVRKEISKVSRSYSGLEKIELGALKSAPVIDPRELEPSDVGKLADLFDSLEKEERTDGNVEAARMAIDDAVKDILDLAVESETSAGND